MTDYELLEAALEVLDSKHDFNSAEWRVMHYRLFEALRARLAQPEQEPVAWRTFDGEGGYEYRDYELNEDYRYWWDERHPN